MTVFVSMNYDTSLNISSDTEGSSAPTADVYVAIGGGGQAIGTLSRDTIQRMVEVINNYIRSDAPPNGPNLLGLLP